MPIPDNSDLTVRLNAIKTTIERGKQEKARAEATLETLAAQRTAINTECAKLGVDPENLDAEIERLRKEMESKLAEAERLLAPATTPATTSAAAAGFAGGR